MVIKRGREVYSPLKKYYRSFEVPIKEVGHLLKIEGRTIEPQKWQGTETKEAMLELMNYSFNCRISSDIKVLQEQIKPNLPWADDHFQERVGGEPLNPGEEFRNWPYFNKKRFQEKFQDDENFAFTHTYMERFWSPHKKGIRYDYGNTGDLIELLVREPYTRQAFLPIWFPEDTGAKHGGRVPCTIGYHFMRRKNNLYIFYPIRSCDYLRHFRDDIYLACRFLLWLLDELKKRDLENWEDIRPGVLNMHIYSLHVFAREKNIL